MRRKHEKTWGPLNNYVINIEGGGRGGGQGEVPGWMTVDYIGQGIWEVLGKLGRRSQLRYKHGDRLANDTQ
mgnify:CR=1 FL=1